MQVRQTVDLRLLKKNTFIILTKLEGISIHLEKDLRIKDLNFLKGLIILVLFSKLKNLNNFIGKYLKLKKSIDS